MKLELILKPSVGTAEFCAVAGCAPGDLSRWRKAGRVVAEKRGNIWWHETPEGWRERDNLSVLRRGSE